jgi:hypothetical protein
MNTSSLCFGAQECLPQIQRVNELEQERTNYVTERPRDNKISITGNMTQPPLAAFSLILEIPTFKKAYNQNLNGINILQYLAMTGHGGPQFSQLDSNSTDSYLERLSIALVNFARNQKQRRIARINPDVTTYSAHLESWHFKETYSGDECAGTFKSSQESST